MNIQNDTGTKNWSILICYFYFHFTERRQTTGRITTPFLGHVLYIHN